MRVTENMNYDTVRTGVHRSRERLSNNQIQSSTLKKVNAPSDDPVASAKILEIRTDKVNTEQFQNNAKMAESFLTNTDHVFEELSEILMRAKDIAINQSSAASANDSTRIGVAEEVTQLYKQAIGAANRRVGDRFLMGGYKTQTPPVTPTGEYKGDQGQMMVEIAKDVYIAVNVPGIEAFNTHPQYSSDIRRQNEMQQEQEPTLNRSPTATAEGDSDTTGGIENAENVNLFEELQNLRIALLTGDLESVRSTLDRLDNIQGKVIASRSKIGSRLQGVRSTMTGLERTALTNAQLNSTLEDADMAQVMSDLAKEETVLRSALQSSQKLIQPTLMDFLK